MQLYTGTDIARGAAIFDFVMATEVERPERRTAMRSQDAIGILAAAFASGLATGQVETLVDEYFEGSDHDLLCATLDRYDGSDGRFHLWNRRAADADRLCSNLRYSSRPTWLLPFDCAAKLAI